MSVALELVRYEEPAEAEDMLALAYFEVGSDQRLEVLAELMTAASVTQGEDEPLRGYTGRTPQNHHTQVALMAEWSQRAGWEPGIVRGAIRLFCDNWQALTGNHGNYAQNVAGGKGCNHGV